MTTIVKGDYSNKRNTAAVVKLSVKNKFYEEAVWNMVYRKLYPKAAQQVLAQGHPLSVIKQIEEQAFKKYDDYDWGLDLLKKGDTIIGFAIWDFPKKNNGKCCLEFLLIDEAEQGKGYGKILMDRFISWANANRPHIAIQIPKNDERCKAFYTKYGFKARPNKEDTDIVDWVREPIS